MARTGRVRATSGLEGGLDQPVVTAVSSTTNEVCSELSSVPVNLKATEAAGEVAYREGVLGVAGVVVEVGEGGDGGAVSGDGQLVELAVVVVVSAVSMCSQKLNVVFVQPAGIVTVWDRVSVWVVP